MKKLYSLIFIVLFSFVHAETYVFSPSGDKLKLVINKSQYNLDFFDSFNYWSDYSGPYNYDGYTDFSFLEGTGNGIKAATPDQKKQLFYAYLRKIKHGIPTHELQSVQEQYLNYVASLEGIIFFDLPENRESSTYPPDYWSYSNYKGSYPLPTTGKCMHPKLGNGLWYLFYWDHSDGNHSFVIAISFEQKNELKWFTTVRNMIKKKS